MGWEVTYLPEAAGDLKSLDWSVRMRVIKVIERVKTNPLPQSEGGYGKPLGNKLTYDLTGLMKVKLLSEGIRVVYKLVCSDDEMKIVVIGARSDEEVYRLAKNRREKHGI